MSDDGYRQSEHYSVFHANRVKRVRVQALERIDGVLVGRDLSDAKWDMRLRVYVAPKATGQTFLLDEPMTKVVEKGAAGKTGKGDLSVVLGNSAVGKVVFECVAVDTSVVDSSTPSGKKEYELDELGPWEATVFASAGAP